jgi:hypothetical protein
LRAAFRNCVHDAADGAAVFRFKAARLDLYILDEVRLEVLAHAADVEVGGIDAVNQVSIFAVAGAIDLEAIGAIAPGAL